MVAQSAMCDRVLGAFLFLFSGFVYAYTYTFEQAPAGEFMVDIVFYPRMLAVVLCGLSIPLLLKKAGKLEEKIHTARELRLLSVYVSFVLYTLILERIGYLLDTFLWIGFMAWLVGERKTWIIILTAFLGTAIGYYLFYIVLRIPLPQGYIAELFQ